MDLTKKKFWSQETYRFTELKPEMFPGFTEWKKEFFRFTEWKPEIFPIYGIETEIFQV